MGVMDRVRQKQAEASSQPGPVGKSSALVRAEAPVVRRFRGVVNELLGIAGNAGTDGKLRTMTVLMRGIAEEVSEEMADLEPDVFASYMAQIGCIVEWIGTGNTSALPDHLKPFAEKIQPSLRIVVDESETEEVKEVRALNA